MQGSIACPVAYDFGTEFIVEGVTYRCDDRMNVKYANENRFDIWMPSKAQAIEWGTKQLTIELKT